MLAPRQIGKSQVFVSAIGLGCNELGRTLDYAASRELVSAAIDCGITFLDTADIYGESESYLGRALRGRRDRVQLATKFGKPLQIGVHKFKSPQPAWDAGLAGPRGSRGYIRGAITSSLRRLNTDYIDLFYLHEPDSDTRLVDTIGYLRELVDEGLVRAIGISNVGYADLSRPEMAPALAVIDAAQEEYNLLDRGVEERLVPLYQSAGTSLIPYYPLASGLLTGKYSQGRPPEPGSRADRIMPHLLRTADWRTVEALRQFAGDHGMKLSHVAIAWLAHRSFVGSVIAGATRPDQVRDNAEAQHLALTAEQIAELDRITATNSEDVPV